MPEYKLCYFNYRGSAEIIRLLFADAGVAYEDFRIKPEDWPGHKPNMQFGKMPVLVVDGVQIANSRAIFRYVARKLGYIGETDLDAAQVDVWIETLTEAFVQLPFSEQDETVKAEKMQKLTTETLDPMFKALEKVIKSSTGPYILKKFSAADIMAYLSTDVVVTAFKVDLSSYPGIEGLRCAVAERPNIKKWLETRPVTQF